MLSVLFWLKISHSSMWAAMKKIHYVLAKLSTVSYAKISVLRIVFAFCRKLICFRVALLQKWNQFISIYFCETIFFFFKKNINKKHSWKVSKLLQVFGKRFQSGIYFKRNNKFLYVPLLKRRYFDIMKTFNLLMMPSLENDVFPSILVLMNMIFFINIISCF